MGMSLVTVSCGGQESGESIDNRLDSGSLDVSKHDTSPIDSGSDTGKDTGKDTSTDANVKDASQHDGTATDVEIPPETCTGNATQIVLSSTRIGGGPMPPQQDLLSRNGWSYVIVTGNCTFHCGTTDGLVYSAKFDKARVAKMLADFEVELIDERKGDYMGDCMDAPDDIISYEGKSIRMSACANPKEQQWITKLREKASQWYASCAKEGKPVTGDMRYTVVEESVAFGPKYHPVAWPLDVSLKSVLEGPDLYIGYVAKGEQATKLRNLRAKALDGQLGPDKTHWIPVNDNGKSYSLFVSDTCTLEDSNGKIPFAFRE